MNKAIRRVLVLVVTVAALAMPTVAKADMITIGSFSLDQFLLPGTDPMSPGTVKFTVTNYTGADFLPPDLPVLTDVILTDLVLEHWVTNAWVIFGPGWEPFSDGLSVAKARLTARLNPLEWTLDDDSIVAVVTPTDGLFSWILEPRSGGSLVVGDSVLLDVRANPVSTVVPEPATMLLIGSGLAALVSSRRARRAKR